LAPSAATGSFDSGEQDRAIAASQAHTAAATSAAAGAADDATAARQQRLGGRVSLVEAAALSLPPRGAGGSSRGPAAMWSQALFAGDGEATLKPRTWSQALFNENEGGPGVVEVATAGGVGGGAGEAATKGSGSRDGPGWSSGNRGIGSKGRKVRPGSVTPSPPGSRPLSRQGSGGGMQQQEQSGSAAATGVAGAVEGLASGGAKGVAAGGAMGEWLEELCAQTPAPKPPSSSSAAAAMNNTKAADGALGAVGSKSGSSSSTPKQQHEQVQQQGCELPHGRVMSPTAIVGTSRLLGSPFASRIPAVPVYYSPTAAAGGGGGGGGGDVGGLGSRGVQEGPGRLATDEEAGMMGTGRGRQAVGARAGLG
jgi:hypothetical protein